MMMNRCIKNEKLKNHVRANMTHSFFYYLFTSAKKQSDDNRLVGLIGIKSTRSSLEVGEVKSDACNRSCR